MQKIKFVEKIIQGLLTALLVLLLAANLYVIAARQITGEPQPSVFGWSWAVVISGSMEPEITVNDLILVQKQDTYVVGDVISYKSGDSVVTHRVIQKEDGVYTTRGDANNTPDMEPVREDAVVGRVMAVIPGIGLVIGYLRTPVGMILLVLLGLLVMELPHWIEKNIKEKDKGGCG